MRKWFLLVIMISAAFSPYILSAGEKTAKQKNHIVAAELSLMGQTDNFSDPYSLPAGIGVLYEFRGFNFPLIIGAEAEWYGFVPLEENYGDSEMFVPSVILGYSFINNLTGSAQVLFSPFISAGEYFRTFRRNDVSYKGSKPIIKSGFDIMLITEKNMVFSIGIFYMLIMDNTPVSFPAYRNRIGYAF